jgi:tellurite resistance protein
MRYRPGRMPESPFAAVSLRTLAGHDSALASAALGRLAGILGEDAIFVLGSGVRDAKDALDGVLQRRGPAYAAALQGQPHARMTAGFDAWYIEMVRALAPVSPPTSVPMMGVVRERVTLELGARGLRSLFSSKPSDKDVTRVKRYGTLAVRTLRAVLAADGSLDAEEYRTVVAVIAALGLPEADANALRSEPAMAAEALDVYGEMDHTIARAIVRGAWLAAAADEIDPREESVIRVVGHKMGIAPEDVEDARRAAVDFIDWRRKAGAAAVDGVRYVLSDRTPGLGVQLAALAGTIMLPRRWRDEALAPVGHGAPVTLAKRHAGLEADDRRAVLGVTWAAAMAEDPSVGRRAVLCARWERFAEDLGEDDPQPREIVERWLTEALAGVARTLQ